VLEFFGLMVATWLAYILVADPAGAPRLPGVLGEIQAEREHKVNPLEEVRKARAQQVPAPENHAAHPLNRQVQMSTRVETFGKILNVKQAASFMNLPEPAIVGMIHEGQLPAVRSGGDYAIARPAAITPSPGRGWRRSSPTGALTWATNPSVRFSH